MVLPPESVKISGGFFYDNELTVMLRNEACPFVQAGIS